MAYTIDEDSLFSISSSQLLTDAGSDPTTTTIANVTVTNGTVVDNLDGTWTFTPNTDFNGVAELNFDILDGETTTPISTIINVTAVNDAPVAVPVTLSATEDTPLVITNADLVGTSTDVDGDILVATNVSATSGTVVDNLDGTWTFTPDAEFNGPAGLTFDVSDGTTTSSSSAVINVDPVNDAPVVVPVTLSATEDTPLVITNADLVGTSTDVDGDILVATNVSATSGTVVDNLDGTWTFTPDAEFNGPAGLTFDVSDGTTTSSSSAVINVAPVNDAPVVVPVTLSATEDTPLVITNADLVGTSTDVDGDILVATNVSATSGTVVDNLDGTWTFTPDANFNGPAGLTFDVSDGTTTSSSSAVINVDPVNDLPVTGLSTMEDTAVIITNMQLVAGSSDPDGDPLTAVDLSSEDGIIVNNLDGTWTFTPNADFNGVATLNYSVSDGETSTPATISINVTAVNDVPVANDVDYNVDEDGVLVIRSTQLLLDSNASDVELDTLTVSSVNIVGDVHGSLQDNGDATWTYTPSADFNGAVSFAFVVSDGVSSVVKKINVTVNSINDAPVVVPVTLSATEDTPLMITNADLVGESSDVDGDILVATNVSAINGIVIDNLDGTWTFTPNANFNGEAGLTFDVSDGKTTTLSSAMINVAPVNDPPIIAISTLEDTPVIIIGQKLVAGSTDADGDPLHPINLSSDAGTIVNNLNGTWTFTPNTHFNGTATLNYEVSDGHLTTPTSISINVIAVNNSPVADEVAYSVDEDGVLIISAAQLLLDSNASDVELDTLTVSSVNISGNAHGSLQNNGDATWTYTPDADFNGSVKFAFVVSDGVSSVVKKINVTVNPINDAPVAKTVTFSAIEDTPLVITNADLIGKSSDVDGDTLVAMNFSATNGTVVANLDGTWTFTPDTNFNGAAELTFEISDGTTTTSSSAVINVAPVSPPILTAFQQVLATAYVTELSNESEQDVSSTLQLKQ